LGLILRQRLCVTVTAPSMTELRRRRDSIVDTDLVELRLDSVKDPDVAGALADRRQPVIVTCRPTWEGGSFTGSEEERKRILGHALDAGADYVDVEVRAGFDALIARTRGKRIVLSLHDFEGVPRDLAERLDGMQASGAEVVKISVTPRSLRECAALHQAAARAKPTSALVVVGMGEFGIATRVLPSRFRSSWSYAGGLAGVGQLTPDALVKDFRFREIGAETALYGLVGLPVSHSVSPAMHNAAFAAAGLDGVYLPLPAIEADDFVAFAGALNVKGASVTTPYKVAFFDRVERASEIATRVGAINTVRIDHGRWLGDNTDVGGFLEPLRHHLSLDGIRAAVLGAGGAARSVAVGLASRGARVTIHARNARRAAEVAALAGGSVGPWPPKKDVWDLLVNTTPVGMYPQVDRTPLPAERLTGRVVYDLVYNPPVTRLLKEAAHAGCRAIGGLDMLVEQARLQFEWWTGIRPSADVMRSAALARLSCFEQPPAVEAATTRSQS